MPGWEGLPGHLLSVRHVCCCLLAESLKETQAELARLRRLAATLESGDAVAAAAKPVAEDADGRLLNLVLRWRQMRYKAVLREVAMLEQREQQLKAGALPGAAEVFKTWLAENGAQVRQLLACCLLAIQCCTAACLQSC
jgi:hypothetical protein